MMLAEGRARERCSGTPQDERMHSTREEINVEGQSSVVVCSFGRSGTLVSHHRTAECSTERVGFRKYARWSPRQGFIAIFPVSQSKAYLVFAGDYTKLA